MRILSVLFVLSMILTSCKGKFGSDAQQTTSADGSVSPALQAMPKTRLSFENDTYDFGKIKEGTIVEHTYMVKNTGNEPLFITNCKASCGCTIPEWPKEAIQPGSTAKIEVKFNSAHKEGDVSKAITVTANTEPEQNFLTIKGFVEKEPEKK